MSMILESIGKHTTTVIFLHGFGETAEIWRPKFEKLHISNVKYILPTAPVRKTTLHLDLEYNAWFDTIDLKPDSPEDERGIKETSRMVLNLVEEEVKKGISTDRIILGGYSQGGAAILYTLLTSSIKFAGCFALSTWLPLPKNFPSDLRAFEGLFETPIVQCHGELDDMITLDWTESRVDLMRKLGFKRIEFKLYKNQDHYLISTEELDDIKTFINKLVA